MEITDVYQAKDRWYCMLWSANLVGHPCSRVRRQLTAFNSVIGAILAQLVLINHRESAQDPTFNFWPYYISTQFVQNLSVITACIPYVKNALVGIESGMLQTGHFHLSTFRKDAVQHEDPRSSMERTGKETKTGLETNDSTVTPGFDGDTIHQNLSRVQNTATAESVTPNEQWDRESQSSRAHIITKTRGWEVGYEDQ